MSERIIREILLMILRVGAYDLKKISESLKISEEKIIEILDSAGISYYDLEKYDKIDLALKYLEFKGDPEKISEHLDWRDFEKFIEKIFRNYGYHVVRGLRSSPPLGFEIDLLATDVFKRRSYVIDCKHWRRSREKILKEVAEDLIERIRRLVKKCFRIKRIYPWIKESDHVIPIIITLRETETRKIFDKVIVAPIHLLKDLIENIDYYIDLLEIKPIKISCETLELEDFKQKDL